MCHRLLQLNVGSRQGEFRLRNASLGQCAAHAVFVAQLHCVSSLDVFAFQQLGQAGGFYQADVKQAKHGIDGQVCMHFQHRLRYRVKRKVRYFQQLLRLLQQGPCGILLFVMLQVRSEEGKAIAPIDCRLNQVEIIAAWQLDN